MIFLSQVQMEQLIESLPPSPNTNFLKSSHNLWRRFHNYEKYPAMALMVGNDVVAVHFATFNKNKYTNSYEIVTMTGHEHKGYAKKLWAEYVDYAVNERGMTRLKNSCVASSVTWHIGNGLIFWAVDPTGSLKTDQPLFPTVAEQIDSRKTFLKNPTMALPEPSVYKKLRKESPSNYNFGAKKWAKVMGAIASAGDNWLGEWLWLYVE